MNGQSKKHVDEEISYFPGKDDGMDIRRFPGSVMKNKFADIIRKSQSDLHPVVPFNPKTERLLSIDLTGNNEEVTEEIFNDTSQFSNYIEEKRKQNKAKYLVGGYGEVRALYGRSELFSNKQGAATATTVAEPRRLHLGVDIWGEEGTRVYAPLGGMIHSFAFNRHYGDYGATIVLLHQLDGFPFYTLYGHLSLADIEKISAGQYVTRGSNIAHFGKPEENGHWPPHLHFQVILDMEMKVGDYPGVCRYSEKEKYLNNCPDPDLILQLNRFRV
jgi:murein DD-endopeptidase MepM/ murein hydrolase activator NlpD